MRVLVTGATNPFGEAVVRALAAKDHPVRAFGVDPSDGRYDDVENVTAFPGWVEVGGSIEPVLSERQVLVHAACLDKPGRGRDGRRKAAIRIERGTQYAVYAAEREQVDHFLHLTPADPGRSYAAVQQNAVDWVHRIRGDINVRVLEVGDDPQATADEAVRLLEDLPLLGAITGGHDNAVTA